MRRLLLLRHAKSDWSIPELGDHARPLNSRGLSVAPRMGEFIKEEGWSPQLVLSSDAERARQTTQLVIKYGSFEGVTRFTRRLYLAEPEDYFDVMSEVPHGVESLLCVAHNPGISKLVQILTLRQVEMSTAALAVIDLQVNEIASVDSATRGELVAHYRPKDLQTVSS